MFLERTKKSAVRKAKRMKFKIGDKVLISKFKATFTKGCQLNSTNNVFTHDVRPTIPTTYYLRDYDGKPIKDSFYEQALLTSNVGDVFLREKIIQRKGDLVKVRWLGFDATRNSLINKKDIT